MKSIIFAILILITVMGSISYVLVTEKAESGGAAGSLDESSAVEPKTLYAEGQEANSSSVQAPVESGNS